MGRVHQTVNHTPGQREWRGMTMETGRATHRAVVFLELISNMVHCIENPFRRRRVEVDWRQIRRGALMAVCL